MARPNGRPSHHPRINVIDGTAYHHSALSRIEYVGTGPALSVTDHISLRKLSMNVYSQSSLQDYEDCHLRHHLKYTVRLAWPAVVAEPLQHFEATTQRGADFHHLIHQHYLGVPPVVIERSINDEAVRRWWDAYLQSDYAYHQIEADVYPEMTLQTTLNDARLIAKFDLLIITPEQVLIVDWKTAEKHPTRDHILNRWQTRLYPYIVTEAISELAGREVTPEQVMMVYWFANFPNQPIMISHSSERHSETHQQLQAIISDIESQDLNHIEKTPHLHHCTYCVYRSYCERGITGGDWDGLSDVEDMLTFDEIEIDPASIEDEIF